MRIQLDANGVLLRSEYAHLRHSRHHGNALGHHGFGVFIEGIERQSRRGQGQIDYRLVCGIDLPERGRCGHPRGKQRRGIRNGRLHVLRGSIQVAAQVELKRDSRAAERVRRGHGIEAGDRGELALEWSGHGRRHRVGARAGKARRHQQCGEIHVRKVAHRQRPVGHEPEHRDRQHHQAGGDGPSNEDFGDVHFLTCTRIPGARRSWPLLTTVSPGRNPFSISISEPIFVPFVTVRISTVSSGLTTKT